MLLLIGKGPSAALVGSISTGATIAGAFSTGIRPNGGIEASAVATGGLTSGIRLSSTVGAGVVASGGLTTSPLLVASPAAGSTATGDLTSGIFIASSVACAGLLSGNITTETLLIGNVVTQTGSNATLSVVSSGLGADLTSTLTIVGSISSGILLSTQVNSVAESAADLSTNIELQGSVQSTLLITSDFTPGAAGFFGDVLASTEIAADLYTDILVHGDSAAGLNCEAQLDTNIWLQGFVATSTSAGAAFPGPKPLARFGVDIVKVPHTSSFALTSGRSVDVDWVALDLVNYVNSQRATVNARLLN